MGLGKTISSIGTINNDTTIRNVLVICPAMLKINWRREANKWLTRPFRITIANGKLSDADLSGQNNLFVIINYELLNRHQVLLNNVAWDLVVVDEAHYCKNYKAQRTKLAMQLLSRARRRLALTGTPVLAAPQDLVEVLAALDPANWGDKFGFLRRYCGFTETPYGHACTKPTKLDELQGKLRSTVMVRRLKSNVLTDLPPKTRQIIALEQDNPELRRQVKNELATLRRIRSVIATEKRLASNAKRTGSEQVYRESVERLQGIYHTALEDIARLRRETALLKLPYVIEHVNNALTQTESGKVVVFAHHVDVLLKLQQSFGSECVLVYGDIPTAERQAAVDRFQADPTCRVFIGGIDVAGVGITLTAASHVVFAELTWTPAKMNQAEDRLHRIGQRNSITVQQMVIDGSIDAHIAKVLLHKQAICDQCLDTGTPASTNDDNSSFIDKLLSDTDNEAAA